MGEPVVQGQPVNTTSWRKTSHATMGSCYSCEGEDLLPVSPANAVRDAGRGGRMYFKLRRLKLANHIPSIDASAVGGVSHATGSDADCNYPYTIALKKQPPTNQPD